MRLGQFLRSLMLALCLAGCAEPANAPPAVPTERRLLSAEFALCDAADTYQEHTGRWPRTLDELKAGAAWRGLDIPQPAYDRTILHQSPDGRLVLEFRRDGGSVYATKPKPPTTAPLR